MGLGCFEFIGRKCRLVAILGCFSALAAGCASGPEDYAGQPGAPIALAKCRMQANMLPSNTNAAANPMFAGAMQQQYVNDCMKAAGYRLN